MEVHDHEVVDGNAEVVGDGLDEGGCALFHAAHEQRRGDLFFADGHATTPDGYVEVAWKRHQRCPPQARVEAQQHDDVGEGGAGGAVAVGCGIVVVEPDGAVGADDEEVACWAGRGLAGLHGGALADACAVVCGDRGVWVCQHAGGNVDAHDGPDGLLEGVEAAGCVDEAECEEHACADEDALGPGAPPGGLGGVWCVWRVGGVRRVGRFDDGTLPRCVAEALAYPFTDLTGPVPEVACEALPCPLQASLQPCCGSVVHVERGYRVSPCRPGRDRVL